MKNWLDLQEGLTPRPIVFVEDRAHHIIEFCTALSKVEIVPGELMKHCTIVFLDSAGSDSEYDIIRLLAWYRDLQIVAIADGLRERLQKLEAATSPPKVGDVYRAPDDADSENVAALWKFLDDGKARGGDAAAKRYQDIPPGATQSKAEYTDLLDQLVRPGGMIVSDVELLTLGFSGHLPPDYDQQFQNAAHLGPAYDGVRAASAAVQRQQEPSTKLMIVSNRMIVFVRSILAENGIVVDEGDVFLKAAQKSDVALKLKNAMQKRFPWKLRTCGANLKEFVVGPWQKDEIDREFDIVFWPVEGGILPISGRAFSSAKPITCTGPRGRVLLTLIKAYLDPKHPIVGKLILEVQLAHVPDKKSLLPQTIQSIYRMIDEEKMNPKLFIADSTGGGYRIEPGARIAVITAEGELHSPAP
eukprot:TRINITY_DN6691_c0_g1_i4.p1 TRINITY_DN6691_c0_g1~~TRINITY_DN6691_c0_g1_i4.p1  ORF type:complete len:415 (+),score=99.76 TRINITY_DN6691_c0_g1_i4:192-1436(+)